MTKEQFLDKWNGTSPFYKADLEAVIATEIAKVQENKPQPALNEIEKAYHNYEPIRYILWKKGWRIKKHSDTESIDGNGKIYKNTCFVFDFDKNQQDWELYTEPVQGIPQPEEPKGNCTTFDMSRLVDQKYKPAEQPAKPFDKDRFEAMFSSMVAREPHWTYKDCMIETEKLLKQLDAYYASKEGGNNG